MIKTYKILVSFGDGRPKQSTIEAKSGQLAQDLAFSMHPGARSVSILGIESVREEPKPQLPAPKPEPVVHPLFTDVTVDQVESFINADKKQKIAECLKLRRQGKSHGSIAIILNVGKTTVGSWIKQYGPG